MSPLDQDAAILQGVSPNGVMGYTDYAGGPARHTESSLEPELEGSSYQTAPITALALARWPWAVVGLVVGALLGFLSATGGGWQAAANLQISAANNANGGTAGGTPSAQSLQVTAKTDAVLKMAAADRAVTAACPAATSNTLAAAISTTMSTDGSLVTITAKDADGRCAGAEANAVAAAVQTQIANASEDAIKKETAAVEAAIANNVLPNAQAEASRVTQLGSAAGTQQAQYLANETMVSPIPAAVANPAGPNRDTFGLLGAAGGAFLGALAGVVAGAGRRRPHSPRELTSLAPDLTVRTTVQAGELAGRVLETGRRTVVVLAMPDTKFAATQLGMAIAHHLRTHGATVALVDRVSEYSQATSGEDRLWALRRDVRRNLSANFSADMLVVVTAADEEALSLIAGQSDLLVSVVAKQRKTILSDIRRTVDAVRVAEPVVVLAR